MDLQSLRYFEAVARHQHLGAAAAELEVYESSLSRSVARLEKQHGALFDRVGRGLKLNPAGRALWLHVRRALAELAEADREIADLRRGQSGAITLGFVPSLGAFVVPDLVTRFKRLHPRAEFRFVEEGRLQLRESLLRGEVDLVLAAHRFDETAIRWLPLWDEELVAVVPTEHPLARRRVVSLIELSREPMLAYKSPHTMRQAVDELAVRAGFVPNIVFEADDAQTLLGLVGTGLGIALLPESIDPSPGRAKVLRLRASRWRVVGLSWLAQRAERPVVVLFRRFIKAAAPQAKRYRRPQRTTARKATSRT